MTIDPSSQPGAFASRQPISEEDVLKLRRNVWADGSISPDEAAQLFELNDAAAPGNEWTDFFVEAMCDFLIARGEPRGYVTEADAKWLIHHISKDGRIDSHAELELVVKLLERADYVPESVKQFALCEIERTVLAGSGPTRRGGDIRPGQVDDSECALLRRLVFAAAGDGPARVSRSEAELLFRLKDATLGADNSADWQRLFVQGVANFLMAHQSYSPISRETAARLEQPYRPDSLRNVLAKLGREPASLSEALSFESESDRIAEHDAAAAQDAEVNSGEAEWLKRLVDGDGARDPMEQALLEFLAEDGIRPF
jgi:hypothetical protein